jgi:Tautomerase enzyme
MVQVTTRPRSRLEKQNFYELLCQELLRRCGVKTSDVVVSITQNADEDWSSAIAEPSSLPENFDFQDIVPKRLRRAKLSPSKFPSVFT